MTIQARDFIVDTAPVVQSASDVAKVVADHIRRGDRVTISLQGIRGVSSSFFNVLLSSIGESLGAAFDPAQLVILTDTATQRMVYERSLQAYRAQAAH